MKPTQINKGSQPKDTGDLESRVVGMALTGKLRKGSRDAIRKQKQMGLAVTFQRGSKIIKQEADGKESILGEVKRVKYSLPKGVQIIGRK